MEVVHALYTEDLQYVTKTHPVLVEVKMKLDWAEFLLQKMITIKE